MELKFTNVISFCFGFPPFNRTAYGIEIKEDMREVRDKHPLLIAPLMELKC